MRFAEIARGLEQFARTENPQTGPIHPIRELTWLTRRAVQEDKVLTNVNRQSPLSDAKMYLQRLREIGAIFTEVFAFQEYSWIPKSQTPRIIDLGGDIGGFSVLYWKSLAPNARVTLVEANPSTATVVTENFKRKGIDDVKVINAAVSEHEGPMKLHLSGYNPSNFAGERDTLHPSSHKTVFVPTVRLSELIGDEKVDLLKMDIEGAEGGVLRELAISGKFGLIDEIMMEFHNDPANPTNSLAEVLQTLKDEGFKIENVHISGNTRREKPKAIDISSIKPHDKLLFSFTAKKQSDT